MADEHPIQGLMRTAMQSIKEMVDVDTIVGEPVETVDGSVIVPISRVSFGFAAGGAEYGAGAGKQKEEDKLGFGGGSGGGVTIQPVGFLVVAKDSVRLLPVDGRAVVDRLIDAVPTAIGEITRLFSGGDGGGREGGHHGGPQHEGPHFPGCGCGGHDGEHGGEHHGHHHGMPVRRGGGECGGATTGGGALGDSTAGEPQGAMTSRQQKP